MFGIGGFELFLILLFGFLIFGPDKLPQLAKTIGMAVQKFRSAQDEMNKVVKTEIYDPASDKPVKNPLDAIDKDNKQKVEKKESFADRQAKYDKENARPPMRPPRKCALLQQLRNKRLRKRPPWPEPLLPLQKPLPRFMRTS